MNSDESTSAYYADIRRTNRRDPKRYDCPDCGRKAVLTASDKAKGYHCSACTAQAEGLAPQGIANAMAAQWS